MKRNWLTVLGAVMAFVLLAGCWPFGSVIAEEIVETQPIAETSVRQIYLVPDVSNDYVKTDTQKLFEKVLRGILNLMPVETHDGLVLFTQNAPENVMYESAAEATSALVMPYEITEPAECLTTIGQTASANDIVIAIESRNIQNSGSIEKKWGQLKQLAANGTDVYLIGLETKKNVSAGKAFASWISDDQLTDKSLYVNQTVEVAENLYFTWIADYNQTLQTLMPLLSKLTDWDFRSEQCDEYGVYTLHPYSQITEEVVVLLDGSWQKTVLNTTDGSINRLENQIVYSDDVMTLVKITQDTPNVNVAAGADVQGMFWAPVYNADKLPKLVLENRDGRNTFERNEMGNFFVSVAGADQEKMAQSMEWNEGVCEIIDVETGEVLMKMEYDDDAQVLRAGYVFIASSPAKQLQAHLRIDEALELVSEPFTVVITNTAPVVTTRSEPIYWLGDPWSTEERREIVIPVTMEDHENDHLLLTFADSTAATINNISGLGTARLTEDQSEIRIELLEKPQSDRSFTIGIYASDGELTSETHEIRFELYYDLSQELQALQTVVNIEDNSGNEIDKYMDFIVSASVLFPDDQPEALTKELQQRLAEHFTCTLHISGPNDELETVPMQQNNRCTISLDQSGEYTLKAVFSSEDGRFQLESNSISVRSVGAKPKRSTAEFSATWDGTMASEKENAEEFWLMDSIIPSALFTDADSDEVTVSVTAVRKAKKEGELPVEVTAEASGDEPAELRFTVAGEYDVTISSHDMDGQGETITCTVHVTSIRSRIIEHAIIGTAALAVAALLIWLIVYLAKPTFKGKIVEVTVASTLWSKTTKIYTDAWKKSKQPLGLLITTAACPPDGMLYAAVDGCFIRPHRKGVMLLKAEKLGLEKKVLICENDSVDVSADTYYLTIKVMQG